MQTYATWSEAGGVGKTTLAFNLAAGHARSGDDVLVIDFDPQNAGVTDHAGLVDVKKEGGDNIVKHLVKQAEGPVDDIVYEVDGEGFDLIPTHNMLTGLEDIMSDSEDHYGEDFEPVEQLTRVLQEWNVQEKYDIVLVDCPATAGIHIKMALYMTRQVLVPVEVGPKGSESIDGIQTALESLGNQYSFDPVILGIIPNQVEYGTRVSKEFFEELDEREENFDVPVELRQRKALFGSCWAANVSVFSFGDEVRDLYDYEEGTLRKIRYLADVITNRVALDSSIEPEEYEPETTVEYQSSEDSEVAAPEN